MVIPPCPAARRVKIRAAFMKWIGATMGLLQTPMESAGRWWILLPVAAAGIDCLPILNHPFVYDEFLHLYNLANFGLLELLLTPHDGHLLYFSNLFFYPFYKCFGLNESAFYALAFVTHLVNVALCYRVIVGFTARPMAAAIAASLWGCAAINSAAPGWFAVYGEVILTTILLWMLSDIAHLAAHGRTPSTWMKMRWAVLLFAAAGSFAYGLVLAATWFAVTTFILEDRASWRALWIRLGGASAAVVFLYLAAYRLHSAISHRTALYGLSARLGNLTVQHILQSIPTLFDFTGYGIINLFIGPIPFLIHSLLPTGPAPARVGLEPLSPDDVAVAARIALLIWLALLIRWLRHQPAAAGRRAIGVGLMALACYEMVAFVNVVFSDPSLAHLPGIPRMRLPGFWTPRYQYLPSVLLIVATMCALPSLPVRPSPLRHLLLGTTLLYAALRAALDGIAVHAQVASWDPHRIVADWLRNSVQNAPVGSSVYLDNGRVPIAFAARDATLPGRAALALLLFPDQFVDGRRVYFVEYDRELLQQLRAASDTPISRMVVAPEEMPTDAYYVPDQTLRPPHDPSLNRQ